MEMGRSTSGGGGGEPEIVEAAAAGPSPCSKVFVALPAWRRGGMSVLSWALRHVGAAGTGIVLTHVHVPPQMIPCMGTKFHASKAREEEVTAYRQIERRKADELLDQYLRHCLENKVQAEKLVLEKEDVVAGLVELISVHGITNFVMGAAVDTRYTKRMKAPKSKKALAVMHKADASCKIWFVCKEELICIRNEKHQAGAEDVPLLCESEEDLPISLPCRQLAREVDNLYSSEVQQRKQSEKELAKALEFIQLQQRALDLTRTQQAEAAAKLAEASEQHLRLARRAADSDRAAQHLREELAAARLLAAAQRAERETAAREAQGLLEQRKALEQWVADTDRDAKAREDDLATARCLLDLQQAECDALQRERDGAVRELEEVRSTERTGERPPSYFICPISQEVMVDPHIAADGFTYEAEAIRDWISRGGNTSPMTNLTLAHHNLIPNRALRSAIQEYLQKKKNSL